jgi:hypothetical protein
MSWTRGVSFLAAGLITAACGSSNPIAHFSPLPTSPPAQAGQAPTPSPTSPPNSVEAGSVTCSGRAGSTLAIVARAFLYDVSDPIHPRLICRANNTGMDLLDNNTIGYTTVIGKHVVIIRRDLTTGAEFRGAQLHMAPNPQYWFSATWTWDGSLEAYGTSVPGNGGPYPVLIHLWSNGEDHVLYTVQGVPGGIESRWAGRPILGFSPDRAYLAISDFGFVLYNNRIRVFSVADRNQKLVATTASSGGTWIANDRFVWATATGLAASGHLMEWTPAGGAKVLRSEPWFGATSSSDGRWLAGTLATDLSAPRVFIVPLGTGRTFRTSLASSPGFVTPTVVWYAEEKRNPSGYDPTSPDGVVHALDVANLTDKVVIFQTAEAPRDPSGDLICCGD